jgi:hypothetical protein
MGRNPAPDPRPKSRREESDVERASGRKPARGSTTEQRQYVENEGLASGKDREAADPVDTTEAEQLEAAARRGRAG